MRASDPVQTKRQPTASEMSCQIDKGGALRDAYRVQDLRSKAHLLVWRLDRSVLRELIALVLQAVYSEPEVVDLCKLARHVCDRGCHCRLEEELVLLRALRTLSWGFVSALKRAPGTMESFVSFLPIFDWVPLAAAPHTFM